MRTSPSLTSELLALPELNTRGVIHSVVFHALPLAAQQSIRATADEQERMRLACEAGDGLTSIAQMHRDLIAAPAQRRTQGVAFPQIEDLDNSFLRGILQECDRQWIRPDVRLLRAEPMQVAGDWSVKVIYADTAERMIALRNGQHGHDAAQALASTITQRARMLGLLG